MLESGFLVTFVFNLSGFNRTQKKKWGGLFLDVVPLYKNI